MLTPSPCDTFLGVDRFVKRGCTLRRKVEEVDDIPSLRKALAEDKAREAERLRREKETERRERAAGITAHKNPMSACTVWCVHYACVCVVCALCVYVVLRAKCCVCALCVCVWCVHCACVECCVCVVCASLRVHCACV